MSLEELRNIMSKSFKIKETGIYKLENGKKAFVSKVLKNRDVYGIIEGEITLSTWYINGLYLDKYSPELSIVSKWKG